MDRKYAWYILKVVSNQEKKIKRYIENEIASKSLESAVVDIVVPVEKVYVVEKGKKKIKERNFLPGYILLSADLTHPAVLYFLGRVNGVIGFLTPEGRYSKTLMPKAVSEKEINAILGSNQGHFDEAAQEGIRLEVPFLVGEPIKVIDGPFREFMGTIDRILEDRSKIVVTIKIFGRETPTELNYSQVEKIY